MIYISPPISPDPHRRSSLLTFPVRSPPENPTPNRHFTTRFSVFLENKIQVNSYNYGNRRRLGLGSSRTVHSSWIVHQHECSSGPTSWSFLHVYASLYNLCTLKWTGHLLMVCKAFHRERQGRQSENDYTTVIVPSLVSDCLTGRRIRGGGHRHRRDDPQFVRGSSCDAETTTL